MGNKNKVYHGCMCDEQLGMLLQSSGFEVGLQASFFLASQSFAGPQSF